MSVVEKMRDKVAAASDVKKIKSETAAESSTEHVKNRQKSASNRDLVDAGSKPTLSQVTVRLGLS